MNIKPGDGKNTITDESVYFYTPRFYVFDNFSAYTIDIWGKEFATGEHAYQWKKFSVLNPDIAQKILDAKSPHAAKKISDAHAAVVDSSWHREKMSVMEEILRAKITQHENVRNKLTETGQKDILENSPVDSYWGIGKDGKGENVLGKLWMQLREELI
jgi:ribA/ribD-fused uncharacterized protein